MSGSDLTYNPSPAVNSRAEEARRKEQYGGGGPEGGPAPEYGYDVIKRIEQEQKALSAEKKDLPLSPAQTQQTAKQQQPAAVAPAQKPLRFYGYKVSPQLISDKALIAAQKGKGDPHAARTWLYVFLDKLLKKQSYHS